MLFKNMISRLAKGKKGFTIVEIIVAISIVSILAAVAVPSVVGFMETGKQTNRNGIARTIYLAAQNQLTEKRIMKSLQSFSSQFFIGDNVNTDENTMVYKKLGSTHGDYAQNETLVRYISKDKGTPNINDPVVALLAPVLLDKEILNDAILIEYNVKTGIVLSAFYGDTIVEFDYDTGGGKSSVYGERGYKNAAERSQGYYGVDRTGLLTDPKITTISLKDGYSEPLISGGKTLKNVLYADILMPMEGGTIKPFDLMINGTVVESYAGTTLGTTFDPSQQSLMYMETGTARGIEAGYARIVWVLDYVGGDMEVNKKHSIFEKYGNIEFNGKKITADANIEVSIRDKASGVTKVAPIMRNPYFLSEAKGMYADGKNKIASARHLYNARYALGNKFTQTESISLADEMTAAKNIGFVPIGTDAAPFAGTYNGMNKNITNLQVGSEATPFENNAGLFGVLGGKVYSLSIDGAKIYGETNAGTIAGSVNTGAMISGCYVKYSTVAGVNNIGGVAGVSAGQINDTTFVSLEEKSPITSTGDFIGGMIGKVDGGSLAKLLYLAIAPQKENTIYPITGNATADSANKEHLYYLSGTPIYPATAVMDGKYNAVQSNGVGEGKGTTELYGAEPTTIFGANWVKDPFTEGVNPMEEMIDTDNKIYPYPFFKQCKDSIAQYQGVAPGWPIAMAGTVESDIKVDGLALSQKTKFDMPLPATAKLSYVRDGKYAKGANAFDACFDVNQFKSAYISRKEVTITNPPKKEGDLSTSVDYFAAFSFDKTMGNVGANAVGNDILWCIVPGIVAKDVSASAKVYEMLEAAGYTKSAVESMTFDELAEALNVANEKTMSNEAYIKVEPFDVKPENSTKHFTILYWAEDSGTSYENNTSVDVKFEIKLTDKNPHLPGNGTLVPIKAEERELKIYPPYFAVTPVVAGRTGGAPYEFTKEEYERDFNLSLNYTGQGMTYLRIKINEEWTDAQGNILPASNSSYYFTTSTNDNRKADGYLYVVAPQNGKISVVKNAKVNPASGAVKVKVSVFVDSVQFNLPYELWDMAKLPQQP